MRAYVFLLVIAACGHSAAHKDAGQDAGIVPQDAPCFTNPQTNDEIINACTTAQKYFKDSHPPLLNADGSLPPLP
jgi:hypothetical protein